ncbi:hypothetical protein C7C46_17170 [Streptomyces tateyamensis]|uniref:Uncharacterized protein n=1 Tax=Streptomyces tateyamensis TaxID=565073 RepID=A0A2V4N559_9ACTN|nr:hypothetical protein [Streptomyces tateyamensis]PYC78064.1 hypothetical protein C7C46_17170 [Streptomyces tateyamensis]
MTPSNTPVQPRPSRAVEEPVVGDTPGEALGRVPMSRLLASCAAAAAVCTPPARAAAARDQATTSTRVPAGAKSQRV